MYALYVQHHCYHEDVCVESKGVNYHYIWVATGLKTLPTPSLILLGLTSDDYSLLVLTGKHIPDILPLS